MWNQVAMAWKKMLLFVSISNLSNWEELMSCSFWWLPFSPAMDLGFSPARATSLHKSGLKRYRDIWRGGQFMTPLEVQENFGLLPAKFLVWTAAISCLYQTWEDVLKFSSRRLDCREWLAVYGDTDNLLPLVVCRAEEGFQPLVDTSMVRIPQKVQPFVVKQSSKTQEEIPDDTLWFPTTWDEYGDDIVQLCYSFICKVRIIEVTRGPKKTSVWLYYGLVSKLEWDPSCMHWPESKEFIKYTSNQGRELLRRQARIPNVVEKKWDRVLPTTYKLRWSNIWDSERVRKEVSLMWMIWHKAVAVNVRRGVISQEIDQNCSVCLKGIRETVLYRFGKCSAAQRAWR